MIEETWGLAAGEELQPEAYPSLVAISTAHFYQFSFRPKGPPTTPEYVYVRLPHRGIQGEAEIRLELFLAKWNWFWEAGETRPSFLADEIPAHIAWLADRADLNIRLAGYRAGIRYDAYATLYHQLPRRILERFGLPCLRRGLWPPSLPLHRRFPAGFNDRLQRAVAFHLWPFLSTTPRGSFSATEPLVLLSHDLDFWAPYADLVAQRRQRLLGRVDFDNPEQRRLLQRLRADCAGEDIFIARPLHGGGLWTGEAEACEVTGRWWRRPIPVAVCVALSTRYARTGRKRIFRHDGRLPAKTSSGNSTASARRCGSASSSSTTRFPSMVPRLKSTTTCSGATSLRCSYRKNGRSSFACGADAPSSETSARAWVTPTIARYPRP